MAGEMTPKERLEAVINLDAVDQIPICPMIDFFAARFTGTTCERFINAFDASEQALMDCFDQLGGWDFTFNPLQRPAFPFSMLEMCRMKLPGRELGADEVWQFVEEPLLSVEDYDLIAEKGLRNFVTSEYLPKILPELSPSEIPAKLDTAARRTREAVLRWEARGIPVFRVAATTTPFEVFSKARSLAEFAFDLRQAPRRVEAAMQVALTEMIDSAIAVAKGSGVRGVTIAASRGSGKFISTRQFEQFYFPYLKEMVTSFLQADLVPILHFDEDWTRNLEYLKEFPKGSCILQLDGFTDIRRAKEVLAHRMCIMGDVPPTLLSLGSASEVREYTVRLLNDVGRDGGFILSSGCSVPVDARPENVRAFVDVGKSYRPQW